MSSERSTHRQSQFPEAEVIEMLAGGKEGDK